MTTNEMINKFKKDSEEVLRELRLRQFAMKKRDRNKLKKKIRQEALKRRNRA